MVRQCELRGVRLNKIVKNRIVQVSGNGVLHILYVTWNDS